MLKDGTFQLVREYQVEGDRVRYYSIDQMGWEEIPESLVDWDATKKEGMDEAKHNVELIAKARATDSARHAEPLDVDASIEIAPKVFLPSGVGLFEFDGKAIYPLAPADPDIKYSMTQRIKQVLVPIPIVPTRHTVSLDGPRAKFRMRSAGVEFYMRTADAHEPNLEFLPYDKWAEGQTSEDATATWEHIARSPNCSIAKAERLLGYAPRYTSLQAVQESVAWLMANGRIR